VAIVNAGLFAETQALLLKHRLLRQVTIAASSSTNLEDALHNVASGLLAANAAEQISILLFNSQQVLQVSATAGEKGAHHLEVRIALGQGITNQAAAEKSAICVDDIQSDARYHYTDTGIRSELAVPILFGEETLGVLNLESSSVAAFNESDEEIIGALGSSLGGIIANIRLVNQVQAQIQRERQLYEATSKIRRSVDLETILETSTEEICKGVGARRARIRITAGESFPEQAGNDRSIASLFQANARNNGRNNTGQSPQEDQE
jgi:GAF domain-containing protein